MLVYLIFVIPESIFPENRKLEISKVEDITVYQATGPLQTLESL